MNLTWVWDRHPDWRVGTAGWFTAPSRWATRVSPDVPEARNAAVDLITGASGGAWILATLPQDQITGNPHGLFVNDASVLCGAPTVNPQGAIMAVAHRNARRLLEDL